MDVAVLREDARLTMRRHVERGGGGVRIPRSAWQGSILRLDPVRVYIHRANLAVVLAESEHAEEGIYLAGWAPSSFAIVYPPESNTSRPTKGGYVFTRTDTGLTTFTKSKPHKNCGNARCCNE
jgi:hypothetical protein